MNKPGLLPGLKNSNIGSAGAAAACILREFKLQVLTLSQRVEYASRKLSVVKEHLLIILRPYETESSIPDHSNDFSTRHHTTPWIASSTAGWRAIYQYQRSCRRPEAIS
jgi:hypothetical protein